MQDCIRDGGKGKPTLGHDSLLWDNPIAPHGPRAVGWRDTQEIPEALPMHSILWEVSQA